MVVQPTSAAKHDRYLLKVVHPPKDSTLAMDRGYMDIAQFQRLTEEGVCYVTKMKKNLNDKVLKSVTYVNPDGLVTHTDQKVLLTGGELTHEARRVGIFHKNKKPVVLLTNNVAWVVLMANLLITVLSRNIKRNCAFSQVVTMVRLTLMYCIDFVAFMEKPDKTWDDILAKEAQKAPPEPSLFD